MDGYPREQLMINSIDIKNYKCFENLHISNCRQVNIIVGDNGTGKTSLLEAIFFALGSTSQMVTRFRQARGFDTNFRGAIRKIEEALWTDYFFNGDLSRTISVILEGSGDESRSVFIGRGDMGETKIPLEGDAAPTTTGSIQFQWRNAQGEVFNVRPVISATGFQFPETLEDLHNFFFFAATQPYSSTENADRFTDLGTSKGSFTKIITDEFKQILDLAIESRAGSPAIYATIKGVDVPLPITSVSGGINRMMTFLLAMASRKKSVVLIDEGEVGLFHTHLRCFWKSMLTFAKQDNSQLFITTHSEEWLETLADVADPEKDDIALWRTERSDSGSIALKQFSGKTFIAGLQTGGEVR